MKMGVKDGGRTPFDGATVQVKEELPKVPRFRRKTGRGEGLSEELYQHIRTNFLRVLSCDRSAAVGACGKAGREWVVSGDVGAAYGVGVVGLGWE